MEGARAAVSGMIDLLCATRGMKPEDAYMLCSVCGDLRISEIVDQPNWSCPSISRASSLRDEPVLPRLGGTGRPSDDIAKASA